MAPTIEDFDILKPISRGAFGKVFVGRKKEDPSKKVYAIKVMQKSEMIKIKIIIGKTIITCFVNILSSSNAFPSLL